jgi:hypothetical protein
MKNITRITLALAGLLLLAFTFGTASPAGAATQPYGGCDEAWQAPHSAGAQDCRNAGWTIRKRLVVNPHGVVRMSTLPHCLEEDGSGQRSACTWNVGPRQDGNGIGLAYWLDRHDRTHYVWNSAPHRVRWQWVTARQAHNMASTGHRAARYWRTCQVHFGTRTTKVACPDGFRYSDAA